MKIFHTFRTWTRRTIWGDRVCAQTNVESVTYRLITYKKQLFLQFQGPTTLLVQSRAARINDILTDGEVNEIADATPGVTRVAVEATEAPSLKEIASKAAAENKTGQRQSVASVHQDGKVDIKSTEQTPPDGFKEEEQKVLPLLYCPCISTTITYVCAIVLIVPMQCIDGDILYAAYGQAHSTAVEYVH